VITLKHRVFPAAGRGTSCAGRLVCREVAPAARTVAAGADVSIEEDRMKREGVRPLLFLAALLVVLVALPTLPRAAAKHVGFQAETTVAFEAGEIQPDLPAPPFFFRYMRTKIGEPGKSGKQAIKIRFKAENTTNRDYIALVTVKLLDENGETVAWKNTRQKIDDQEAESFGAKFRLAASDVERIVNCRVEVTAKVE